MTSNRRWAWLLGGCLVLVLAVAACGGDEEEAEADDPGGGEVDEDLDPAIAEAQAEAEELGLRFATSKEEIMEGAREEGELLAIWSIGADEDAYEMMSPFEQTYDFLDVTLDELDGVEARERFLLEAEAGAIDGYGIHYAATEVYDQMADMCDWDIYGMAEAGILDIPLEMIDPDNRKVVAAGSTAAVFAYNVESFADRDLPEEWDDVLDPARFGPESGLNMLGDVRIANFSSIVPAWGLDRAKEYYAEYFEEIDPTPVNRFGPFLIQMAQGEYDGFPFVNLHSVEQRKPDYPNMDYIFIEPVPIRLSETHCVFNDDINPTPYASLLFLEWTASHDGQSGLEQGDQPYQSHINSGYPGGLGELLEDGGYELSVSDFEYFADQADYIEEIIGAAGFPQPIERPDQ